MAPSALEKNVLILIPPSRICPSPHLFTDGAYDVNWYIWTIAGRTRSAAEAVTFKPNAIANLTQHDAVTGYPEIELTSGEPVVLGDDEGFQLEVAQCKPIRFMGHLGTHRTWEA